MIHCNRHRLFGRRCSAWKFPAATHLHNAAEWIWFSAVGSNSIVTSSASIQSIPQFSFHSIFFCWGKRSRQIEYNFYATVRVLIYETGRRFAVDTREMKGESFVEDTLHFGHLIHWIVTLNQANLLHFIEIWIEKKKKKSERRKRKSIFIDEVWKRSAAAGVAIWNAFHLDNVTLMKAAPPDLFESLTDGIDNHQLQLSESTKEEPASDFPKFTILRALPARFPAEIHHRRRFLIRWHLKVLSPASYPSHAQLGVTITSLRA